MTFSVADLTKVLRSEENKMYIEKSFENMECAIRILHLRSWDTRSIMLADIVYSLSLYADNTYV